jgi:hypothetical protein
MINRPHQNEKKVDIVLPPVWSGVYYNTARLLLHHLEDIGHDCLIKEAGDRTETDLSVVLGWNLIPDSIKFHNPYIIYQLEPLCLEHWRQKLFSKISFFKNAQAIWDYSGHNQKYLNEYGLNSTIVPLGYHQKMNEITHKEFADFDVLFVGFLTERRHKILEELNKHCCVSVQPRWGNDFSKALGRSKILLNIHQYDIPTPLEQSRISYAINNNCFVLSEESIDNPYKSLVTKNYDNLLKETLNYLHDGKLRIERRNKVFDSFKSFQTKDLIEKSFEMLNIEQ